MRQIGLLLSLLSFAVHLAASVVTAGWVLCQELDGTVNVEAAGLTCCGAPQGGGLAGRSAPEPPGQEAAGTEPCGGCRDVVVAAFDPLPRRVKAAAPASLLLDFAAGIPCFEPFPLCDRPPHPDALVARTPRRPSPALVRTTVLLC